MNRDTDRRAPRRTALNEAEIVAEALTIIKQDGVDGLTMRRLSDRLGVALGATYKHVPTKDHLLRLVTTELYSQVGQCELDSNDWRGGIHSFLVRFREVVSAYPGMASYISSHSADPEPDRLYQPMNEALLGAGFPPTGAARVLRVLFFYTSGAMLAPPALALGGHAAAEFSAGLDLVLDGACHQFEGERTTTTACPTA